MNAVVPARRLLAAALLAAAPLAPACDDEDDGSFPGAGSLRLLVATRGPAALELLDAETLEPALDSPLGLSDVPVEARAAGADISFVATFDPPAEALAFDAELFEEEPGGRLGPGARVELDPGGNRLFLAGDGLDAFDATTFSELFPGVDLDGAASDVVYEADTDRVFVAVTGDRARLQVFDADDLSEVPPSPVDLGDAGSTTGDLLVRGSEVFVALPRDERIAIVDVATLRDHPRSPIDLRVEATALALDPDRQRVYAGAADGRLDAVGATDFSLAAGFPRDVAGSLSDLAYEAGTQRLVVADSAARRLIVLDGLTLEEERDSPVRFDGAPVSVEVLDLTRP